MTLRGAGCQRVTRAWPRLRLSLTTFILPTMNLKTAAFLAFIGTILVTALLVWNLIFTVANVMRGLIPAVALIAAFVYTFAALTVTLFFYAFKKAQPD